MFLGRRGHGSSSEGHVGVHLEMWLIGSRLLEQGDTQEEQH